MNRIVVITLVCACFGFSARAQKLNETERKLLDAPDKNEVKGAQDTISYEQALKYWKSVEDVNRWIGKSFHYDISRAIALGSKREQGPKVPILTPSAFFLEKSGICVDLSRFAFETLKKTNPELETHYLMIDFEPIEIQGSIIRKHWVVAYKKDQHFYVVADSKRPGIISGPYDTIEKYIEEYEEYRQRKIESFKLLNDYKKTQKKRLVKAKRTDKKGNQVVKG